MTETVNIATWITDVPQVGDVVSYEDCGYRRTGTVTSVKPYGDGTDRVLLELVNENLVRWVETWDAVTMTTVLAVPVPA